MPHAPAEQGSGENEDRADVSQHPKHRDLRGEGDPAPCWEGCPPTQPGRRSLSCTSAPLTPQANASALHFYQPFACTDTPRREEKGSFVTKTTAG